MSRECIYGFESKDWNEYGEQLLPNYVALREQEKEESFKVLGYHLEIFSDWDWSLERIKSSHHLFYMEDEQIKGVMSYTCDEKYAMIQLLYVKPEYRRQGIAKELIDYFKGMFKGLEIFINVQPNNTPAFKLYQKVGFIPITQCLIFKEES